MRLLSSRRRLALVVGTSIGLGAFSPASPGSFAATGTTGATGTATLLVTPAAAEGRPLAAAPQPSARATLAGRARVAALDHRRAILVAPPVRHRVVGHVPGARLEIRRSVTAAYWQRIAAANVAELPARIAVMPSAATSAIRSETTRAAPSNPTRVTPAPAPTESVPNPVAQVVVGDVNVAPPAADAVPNGDLADLAVHTLSSGPTRIGAIREAATVGTTDAAGTVGAVGPVGRSETSEPIIAGPRGEYNLTYDSVGGSISVLIDPSTKTVLLTDISPAEGWLSTIRRNDGKVKVVMTSDASVVTFSISYRGDHLVQIIEVKPVTAPEPDGDDDDEVDDGDEDDEDDDDDEDDEDDDDDEDDED